MEGKWHVERLSSLDASFLYIENSQTPMNIGSVSIFQPSDSGFEHETLVKLIKERLAFVPRYRQRVKAIPLGMFRPVWVDDTAFDVSYHVRRSALPKPGNAEQLDELVARLMSRPLDRSRPLWEMYLIEGLSGGRFAIVTKSHEAMVDGLAALDISQVILDSESQASAGPPDSWRPATEPSGIELMSASVTEVLAHPTAAAELVASTASEAFTSAQSVVGSVVNGATEAIHDLVSLARFRTRSPLKAKLGAQRRFVSVDVDLEELREVRKSASALTAESISVNDIILTVLTGALRSWLIRRDGLPSGQDRFNALVPVSLDSKVEEPTLRGSVNAYVIELPVAQFEPVDRLMRVVEQMSDLDPMGEFLGARAIIDIAGFGPASVHALGARMASTLTRRAYDVTITNVPGPQHALYAAGSQMLASYPCVPLVPGQALSIGLTSYHGSLCIGLMADRDALEDLDVIAESIRDSIVGLQASIAQRRSSPGGNYLRVVAS
ncbi:MAG TPA: wax ester/triacylglycerol synthase family O-acyltransferase [Actinobacteria bacterium]|nr:wax ester/triacylglycerol synthase family O-acyltransferase [Actinomycetota bacterium]